MYEANGREVTVRVSGSGLVYIAVSPNNADYLAVRLRRYEMEFDDDPNTLPDGLPLAVTVENVIFRFPAGTDADHVRLVLGWID